MISWKSFITVYQIFIHILNISCQEKSSVTFVIDRTNSMRDDINQVMDAAEDIMNIMHTKQSSQVENVVLVTFDDKVRVILPEDGNRIIPGYDLRAKTNDLTELQKILRGIQVVGNWDCPEMSLSGTRLGLEESAPGSYIYVFTDDGPKDFELTDAVKSLAQRKQNQVVFIITPNENCPESTKSFTEYYTIAAATSGQVFRLKQKSDVKSVLTYVEESISGLRTVVTSKLLPPNVWSEIEFTIDEKTEYGIVSTSGKDVEMVVEKNPGEYNTRIWLSNVKIIRLEKPGTYKIKVKGSGTTSVMVFGRTDFTFKHGFSVFKPKSLDHTSTKPIPGKKSYLTIKIIDKEGDVDIKTLRILDMDENINMSMPLFVLDEQSKLYITEAFEAPDEMFKVAIVGYNKTNKTIVRISPTPVEPQEKNAPLQKNIPPTATIEGGRVIQAQWDKPLELKCKVTAYPEPVITWVDKNGKQLDAETVTIYLDYEYLSTLQINKVNSNNTYHCKAVNSVKEDIANVTVATIRKYFDVLEFPKDTAVPFTKSAKLKCRVSAFPSPIITWYRNGTVITGDDNLLISNDNYTLTINNMQLETAGHYMCEARNEINRKLFHANVTMTGVDPPVIDKTITNIRGIEGSPTTMNCRIIKGTPKPSIRWSFESNNGKSHNTSLILHENFTIKSTSRTDSGVYRCEAENIVGHDFHEFTLTVEYPPAVKVRANTVVLEDAQLKLSCQVDGLPVPKVAWKFNGDLVDEKAKHIDSDHSLRFKAALSDVGQYTCEATNEHGTATAYADIDVYIPPAITSSSKTIKVVMGRNLILECQGNGYPEPKIEWTFQNVKRTWSKKISSNTDGSLAIPFIKTSQDGLYTCTASNAAGSASVTYTVVVGSPPDIAVSAKQEQKVVSGDVIVSIPCPATGNPKPSITWLKAGNPLVIDEYSFVSEDGTLFLGNVDKAIQGDYCCMAQNEWGKKFESFHVYVDDYPTAAIPTSVVRVEAGNPTQIPCKEQHFDTDQIRWYKNGQLITTGPLILRNPKISDSDVYVCRVSNFEKSVNENVRIVVGYEPEFYNKQDDERVLFEKDNISPLECSADAYPDPQFHWWHNGKVMNYNEDTVYVGKNLTDRGEYICVVNNDFGNISRRFIVESEECLINKETDFSQLHPLVLTTKPERPFFETLEGHIRIPTEEKLYLYCPDGFANFNGQQQVATCLNDTNFEINGKIVKFQDTKCRVNSKPKVIPTGQRCASYQTELMHIGYEIKGKFFKIYEVCLNKYKKTPVYSKYNIDSLLSGETPQNPEWFDDDLLPMDFTSLYDCSTQIENIHSVQFKSARQNDSCCFSERQLVNPKDVMAGLAQSSTYIHLNTIPHWSTCNEQNWNDVESRVRMLALNHGSLEVWTGVSNDLKLRAPDGSQKKVFLRNGKQGQKQSVPTYLWKVLRDTKEKASIAIIQVNVPDFNLLNAYKYVRCSDICNNLTWMFSESWHDPKRGYTYCCTLKDFSENFNIKIFGDVGSDEVLDIIDIPNSDA